MHGILVRSTLVMCMYGFSILRWASRYHTCTKTYLLIDFSSFRMTNEEFPLAFILAPNQTEAPFLAESVYDCAMFFLST